MNDVSPAARALKPWSTIVVLSLLPWAPLVLLIAVFSLHDVSRKTVEELIPFTWVCLILLLLLECTVIGASIRFVIQRSVTAWQFIVLHHFTALLLAVVLLKLFS